MDKRDARKLSSEELYCLRKQYVQLREQGYTNRAAAAAVGISETRACAIWKLYDGDVAVLKPKNRGREKGAGRKLTIDQEADIRGLLIATTPDKVGLDVYLWTRNAVRAAIKKRHDIDLPLRTVTDYLNRWGLWKIKFIDSLDNDEWKSYKRWLKSDYSEVLFRSKMESANINWFFVKNLNNIEIYGDKKVTLLAAISNQGQIRLMLRAGKASHKTFKKILSSLNKDS